MNIKWLTALCDKESQSLYKKGEGHLLLKAITNKVSKCCAMINGESLVEIG